MSNYMYELDQTEQMALKIYIYIQNREKSRGGTVTHFRPCTSSIAPKYTYGARKLAQELRMRF